FYLSGGLGAALFTMLRGSLVAGAFICVVLLTVPLVAAGLWITDRTNRYQAPHLQHRVRLRPLTFCWAVGTTVLVYGLAALSHGQSVALNVIYLQLDVLQFVFIAALLLTGTDFAEWAEVVGGRISSLLERGGRTGPLVALVVVAVLWLGCILFLLPRTGHALGPRFEPGLLLAAAAAGAVVLLGGWIASPRPLSTRVPFWALAIGAIVLWGALLAPGLLPSAGPAAAGTTGPSPATTFLASTVASLLLLGLGLLLLRARGERATGGLFLVICALFLFASPVGLPGVLPFPNAAIALSLGVPNALSGFMIGALLLVGVTELRRRPLPVPVLRLLLVFGLGMCGLFVLYSWVFPAVTAGGARFDVLQGLVLLLAMLWDVLMSGEPVTNRGGLVAPRHTRVLLYLGYTIMLVTTVLFLGSLRGQGDAFESDLWPPTGIEILGAPLLITFCLVNLAAWRRHQKPDPEPGLDQIDRSALDEEGLGRGGSAPR
ncbi:MAG: hypothetical protein WAM30_18540, partial [Candidatus Dormiibacterota bacterium]